MVPDHPLQLVSICRLVSAKYTRSKVRKALPRGFEYVIDELLHAADTNAKAMYNHEIVRSIIETDQADAFIIAMSDLIQRLVIDRLHIVGDIFDRGRELTSFWTGSRTITTWTSSGATMTSCGWVRQPEAKH